MARATATEGSRNVPLGVLAPLLPAGSASNEATSSSRLGGRDVLRTQGRAVRSCCSSMTCPPRRRDVGDRARPALDSGLCSSSPRCAPVRPPAGLDPAWQRGRVRRIDLADLDRIGVDTLLHLVLHDPVEATTIGAAGRPVKETPVPPRTRARRADSAASSSCHGVWRLVDPSSPRNGCASDRCPPAVHCRREVSKRWNTWPCGSRQGCRRSRQRSGRISRTPRPGRAADRSHRRTPRTRTCRPPAVPRDRARPHAGPHPASPAAGARRPDRGPRRPSSRGSDTRRPARLDAPGRPIRRSSSTRPDWPASRPRLHPGRAAGGRRPRAGDDGVGVLLGEAFHELGRFEEAERC